MLGNNELHDDNLYDEKLYKFDEEIEELDEAEFERASKELDELVREIVSSDIQRYEEERRGKRYGYIPNTQRIKKYIQIESTFKRICKDHGLRMKTSTHNVLTCGYTITIWCDYCPIHRDDLIHILTHASSYSIDLLNDTMCLDFTFYHLFDEVEI